MMSKDPATRLQEARRKAGYVSARAAAANFEWPESTYRSHEAGTRGYDEELARRYGRAFGVSHLWLLHGVSPKDVEARASVPDLTYAPAEEFDAPPKGAQVVSRGVVNGEGAHGIPDGSIAQVDSSIGLGLRMPPDVITIELPAGNEVVGVPVLDTWRIPPSVLARRLRTSPRNVHFVECEGDSMEPLIKDGDVVLVDQTRRNPNMPGVFALYEGNGYTLKRVEVVRGSEPEMLRLIPANPAYSTYEVRAEDVHIIGRYVARFTVD